MRIRLPKSFIRFLSHCTNFFFFIWSAVFFMLVVKSTTSFFYSFFLSFSESSNVYTEFDLYEAPKLLQHPSFDTNHMTIIYIHGWNEKMNEAKTLLVIVQSYLTRRNHNILVLNYETLSKKFYSIVVDNAKEVRKWYARILTLMYSLVLHFY